jgi:hypothetical protein
VNVVWIILAVVAVIVVIAVVAMMRRGRSAASETAAPQRGRPAEYPRAEGGRVKEKPAEVGMAAPEPPSEVRAPVPEPEEIREVPPEVSPAAATGSAPVPSAEEVVEERSAPKPEPAEPVKPRLSEDEIRSRLQLQLADSERMLKELKEATAVQEEGAEPNPLAGSVQIIEEGLSEVRSLAERKEWGHAKDKGEALHAQLALMLQMARRGGSS